MPPKHPNHRVNPADRLALAIIGLKTGKYSTASEAAIQNGVSERILRARVTSIPTCPLFRVKKCKSARSKILRLTTTEENTLHNWIIQLHESGRPIVPTSVQGMANTLLAKRGGTHGYRVSEEWVSGYLQFHPDIGAIIDATARELDTLNLRPMGYSPKGRSERSMAILHLTRRMAELQNEQEAALLEGCEKIVLKHPEYVRRLLVILKGGRHAMEEAVKYEVDRSVEMIELFRDEGRDCGVFLKALEEIEAIMQDTAELKQEIEREFGQFLEGQEEGEAGKEEEI